MNNLQRILLSIFGLVTMVAINGCVVHEHGHDWHHEHSHTVVVEPAR